MLDDVVDDVIRARPIYGVVYLAVNKVNGKKYVGITKHDLYTRIWYHLRSQNKTIFGNALRAYDLESFEFSVIDMAFNRAMLCEKEQHWIKVHNCIYPNGYNLTTGGEHPELSLETRAKMSATHKLMTDELQILHISNIGKRRSAETRAKMSAAAKGRLKSLEHRAAISKSHQGKTLSPETRAKISKAGKGRVHSLESRAKMSAAQRGKPKPPAQVRNNRISQFLGANWNEDLPIQ